MGSSFYNRKINMKNKDITPIVEGVDFYYNEEKKVVFTEAYLLKRGYCCNNKCKHCPYKDSDKRFLKIDRK